MSNIDELTNLITADIAKADEANASIDGSKSTADELATSFQSLGVEDKSAGIEEVKSKLDEAQGLITSAKAKLEEASTMASGLTGGLAAASVGSTTIPPNRPTPLNAAPAKLKEPVAKVGDPVTAPVSGHGDTHQELRDPDAGDDISKAARAGRVLSRRSGDIEKSYKDHSNTVVSIAKAYGDGGHGGTGETVETVGMPDHRPTMSSSQQHASDSLITDGVSTAILSVAAVITVVGQHRDKRKRKK